MAFEIVCCIGVGDPTAFNQLMPIANHPLVTKIWIIRASRLKYGNIPKSEYIVVSTRWKILRFIFMLATCIKLAQRNEVKAFVSFNPVPYGLFSFVAAKLKKKPIHFGFIGSDWNLHGKGKFSKLLLALCRKVDFLTATGKIMKEEIVGRNLSADRISILPHCLDLSHFTISTNVPKAYASIFIGNLIEGKKVDVIIRGFADIVAVHPEAKLCIVGSGPLMQSLNDLAQKLNIHNNVEFTGFVNDVQPYIAKSKSVVIASTREGFPYALVEGICSGVVPVSTPVGTIPDIIKHEYNGLIFKVNDSKALGKCILKIVEDRALYNKLQANVLKLRDGFSYSSATNIWDKWFGKINV